MHYTIYSSALKGLQTIIHYPLLHAFLNYKKQIVCDKKLFLKFGFKLFLNCD